MDANELSPERVALADKIAKERDLAMRRELIRQAVERKIPRLIERTKKQIEKNLSPTAGVIVSEGLKFHDDALICEVVNELLDEAGATGLGYSHLDWPRSNPYVPIPTGIFTRLYVGPRPAPTR